MIVHLRKPVEAPLASKAIMLWLRYPGCMEGLLRGPRPSSTLMYICVLLYCQGPDMAGRISRIELREPIPHDPELRLGNFW